MLKEQFPIARKRFVKRTVFFILLFFAAVSLTGCITFLTEINVKGDGSGTMVQTITMNLGQIKESVEGVAKQMGATMTEAEDDTKNKPAAGAAEGPGGGPLKEDLEGKAVDLGQGVTFMTAEKIETKAASGVRVTYAFKDVNQLAVNPKPAAAMGTEGAGASSKDALKFRFSHLPDGNAVLTVVLPQSASEAPKEQTAKPPSDVPAPEVSPVQPDQGMAMMAMQMFKGLHMGMSVTVEGKIVKTNSPYAEGSKVTLMDIDFDQILSDEKAFRAFSGKMDMTTEDDRKIMEALKGIKGVKITTAPEVSIEFSPDRKP